MASGATCGGSGDSAAAASAASELARLSPEPEVKLVL
jgi:hypothetical protein